MASSPALKNVPPPQAAGASVSSSGGKPVIHDLGEFELLERIGKGAMGTVFKAHQKSLKRMVAVKVLAQKWAKDDVNIERFNREARAAAALSHPGIVQCINVGEHNGVHFIAMELLQGETVAQRLKREKKLPLADVIEIGRQVALALGHAHSRGILHRDIKPANLMLMSDTAALTVKLMDLGLARTMNEDGSLTRAGVAMGTPYYISPEQARGVKTLTPACDLYSLGVMLLHLVTGLLPYEGMTEADIMAQHVRSPVPEPREFDANIPENFAAVLRKLMAKDPAERVQSAEELAEILGRIGSPETAAVEGGGSRSKIKPARRVVRVRRARSAASPNSYLPGAIVAAVIVIAAIALTNFWQSREKPSESAPKAVVRREVAEPVRAAEAQPVRPLAKKPVSTVSKEPSSQIDELQAILGPQGKPESTE